MPLRGKRILLGVSGSVAAYKAVEILRGLQRRGADVQVAMTEVATKFVSTLTFEALSHRKVHTELFPESGDPDVVHVRVADWPDLMVVAPATANLIGKLANGLADDLLTCTLLAGDCPLVVAPAMESSMYGHPAVQKNLQHLRGRGVHLVDPEEGDLASGHSGIGRLADPEIIVTAVADAFKTSDDFTGKRIVITAGRTEEDIDPVRFITNRSTGKMGYAVAERAMRRGAEVILVSGPTNLDAPVGAKVIPVRTVSEMQKATGEVFDKADALIMTAAVLDFRPETVAPQKIKKSADGLSLNLIANHDFLVDLGAEKRQRIVVGFAMETENGLANARRKLKEKHLDLIVLNDLTVAGAGFGVDTNVVTLLESEGEPISLPKLSKLEVADRILDRLESYWAG
ncbi:MAG: bifunctional phosphopantothenoylcysteine decarboxylase/phosphopantothenate--cysteine ligase CoaBC [Gemmatimonadetes bacterium]|nr:bifunctional phosphopantothenoylcysteine decarboxylase/phosphopantothenate--cysteine ligase CoaBC [Gemmatimonadota bacterium]